MINPYKTLLNSNESIQDLILHSNDVSIQKCNRFKSRVYKNLFTVKEIPDNLCNGHILNLQLAPTTYYGTNSIFFRACQVWNNLPLSMKESH